MKKSFTILALLISTSLNAEPLDSFYIGLDTGYSSFSDKCDTSDQGTCTSDGFAFGLLTGSYIFEHISAEVGYTKPNEITVGEKSLNMAIYDLGMKFELPLTESFKFNIKPALAFEDIQYSPTSEANNGDIRFSVQAGLEYKVTPEVGISVNYKYYEGTPVQYIESTEQQQILLGFRYYFGSESDSSFQKHSFMKSRPADHKVAYDSSASNIVSSTYTFTESNKKMGPLIFASSSSDILDSSGLDRFVSSFLGSNVKSIKVVGHTDSTGSKNNNELLSFNRALSVKNYLIKSGFSQDQIQVEGLGEVNPIDTNETSHGRQNNRRVEIEVLYLK